MHIKLGYLVSPYTELLRGYRKVIGSNKKTFKKPVDWISDQILILESGSGQVLSVFVSASGTERKYKTTPITKQIQIWLDRHLRSTKLKRQSGQSEY